MKQSKQICGWYKHDGKEKNWVMNVAVDEGANEADVIVDANTTKNFQ